MMRMNQKKTYRKRGKERVELWRGVSYALKESVVLTLVFETRQAASGTPLYVEREAPFFGQKSQLSVQQYQSPVKYVVVVVVAHAELSLGTR